MSEQWSNKLKERESVSGTVDWYYRLAPQNPCSSVVQVHSLSETEHDWGAHWDT